MAHGIKVTRRPTVRKERLSECLASDQRKIFFSGDIKKLLDRDSKCPENQGENIEKLCYLFVYFLL